MNKVNIPVGVSDFVKLRQNNYYYIDKSALIQELLKVIFRCVLLHIWTAAFLIKFSSIKPVLSYCQPSFF